MKESIKSFKEGNLLFQKLWESLGKEGIVGIGVNKWLNWQSQK